MQKKIAVVPYNPNWPKIFSHYADQLSELLEENCVTVHHIGSTSVPGLCAKPKIDILCVVHDLKAAVPVLVGAGYEFRGEFNLPLRLFFRKRVPDDINLHLVNENSDEIDWHLTFRDFLRKNTEARELYANAKLELIKKHAGIFGLSSHELPEYAVLKGATIRKIAKMAGFNGYRLVFIGDRNEIDAYKKLLGLNFVNFNDKNFVHFVLYKGVDVVAAACVQVDQKNAETFIKRVGALHDCDKNVIIEKIKTWLIFHGLKLVCNI